MKLCPTRQMEGIIEHHVLEERNPHLDRGRHADAVVTMKNPRQVMVKTPKTMGEECPIGARL